jgi:hypothetical protein
MQCREISRNQEYLEREKLRAVVEVERSRGLSVQNSLASTRSPLNRAYSRNIQIQRKLAGRQHLQHTELKTMGVDENVVDLHGSSHFEMKTVRIDEKLVDMRGSSHCVLTRRRELYHSALTSH